MKYLSKFFKRKFIKRLLIFIVAIPVTLLLLLITVLYVKQDEVVQEIIATLNEDFEGKVSVEDSHISPFANFPHISIDLENVRVFESKQSGDNEILHLEDVYLGFNLWSILSGDMTIRKLRLSGGVIDLVQHEDGTLNLINALASKKTVEEEAEALHIDLKKVRIDNVDINKLNEQNGIKVDALIQNATAKLSTSDEEILAGLDLSFTLNLIKDGDTTFFKHKHITFNTDVHYRNTDEFLQIDPTEVSFEGASFNLAGKIDFKNDMDLDLHLDGNKPNFDLFIALAPEDLIPTLKTYENRGKIFFKADIKGKSVNGHQPAVRVDFGCENGFFQNKLFKRKLDKLQFRGYFTNGDKRTAETMEFRILNFQAKPEVGVFEVDLRVKDFNAPEIFVDVNTNMELNYIKEFFEVEEISKASGRVDFKMKFRDIIDIEHPERMIERFNESYQMSLHCTNVQLESPHIAFPINSLNIDAVASGHELAIKQFELNTNKSDLHISGKISDLPAIVHHTNLPVSADLHIKSKKLSFAELSGTDNEEAVSNLQLDLAFLSTARNFTEFDVLPKGEFIIDNFYAKLKKYPHTFHDFHADLIVSDESVELKKFHGEIDRSDLEISGKLLNLAFLMNPTHSGDVIIDYNIKSNQLQLHDLLTYNSEHFLPEEYRQEEFDHLHAHGKTNLHFKQGEITATDSYFDHLSADLKIHPVHVYDLNGRVHTDPGHIVLDDLNGRIGQSDFHTTLHYYFGDKNKKAKRENKLIFKSSFLNIDELLAFSEHDYKNGNKVVDTHRQHVEAFNIYTLPFPNMSFQLDIGKMNYHRYKLANVKGKFHTTEKHYLYIDRLAVDAAGGHFDIKGYFNGSDPKHIYLSPEITLRNVELDQLLFKFENFGQDHIVAENLHGKFSGKLSGKILVYPDLTPKIDDSEIHIDMAVTDGKLENYAVFDYMADYFKDKNLSKVLFDTLQNHIDLKNGKMSVPEMEINSTLGHIILWGEQDMNYNMEYFIKIPVKMITSAASSKLFKKKNDGTTGESDEIEYGSDKTAYVTLRITGNEDGYQFSISKKKKIFN